MEEKISSAAVIVNPYVTQADKLAVSLRHLADRFLKMEPQKEYFTSDELMGMFEQITGKVCASCSKREECLEKKREDTGQMLYELLSTIEEYGTELNTEMKRKLQRQCIQAPRFLRETLEVFQEAKRILVWNNKIVQNREGCAAQLDSFADMICHAARNLDASIFTDPPLAKKISHHFRKAGIRMLNSVFFVDEHGRYEIHVTVKCEKGQCIPTKKAAEILSACTKRRMCPAQNERQVLGQDYETIVCVEGPGYYVLQGVARIGKDGQKISGDSFLMKTLPGGREAAILSDGMGSGESALKESGMLIEMLEELLGAGFPVTTALSMINTALVMGREEVRFSTVDMSIFDLYSGMCEFVKAGAAETFLRTKDGMEHIQSESLPLGVIQRQESQKELRQLESGDMVVMLSDGVLDALPAGEQEHLLDLMIGGSPLENPEELANYILEKVLELAAGKAKDDMTVLVAGIWKMCYSR